MAKSEDKDLDGVVSVPTKLLTQMQEQMAEMEKKLADSDAKTAGLEELFSKQAEAGTEAQSKLRQKKTFEPKFRTVRVRKYPIAGNPEKLGYVIGWTSRGAYQEVDRTGISPVIVDYLDIIFLGHEKNEKGVLKAEKVKLLDLFNKGIQVHCKIVDVKKEDKIIPTNEEIDVTIFDPAHGLISTGEKIDGFVTHTDLQYKIHIPGVQDEVWVDAEFLN